jgi:hypothetical protein
VKSGGHVAPGRISASALDPPIDKAGAIEIGHTIVSEIKARTLEKDLLNWDSPDER